MDHLIYFFIFVFITDFQDAEQFSVLKCFDI
jgi:hypothetical protein